MPQTIECNSAITRVTVYARGAVVTRRVEMPLAVPPDGCTLALTGITPLAEPGSLRTHVDGEREINGLTSRIVHPSREARAAAPDVLARLQNELRRIDAQHERAQTRRDHFAGLSLQTAILNKKTDTNVAGRMGDALAISALISDLTRKLDAEIAALEAEREKLQREYEAAEMADGQSGESGRGPTREISIHFAPGSGHLRALEISYSVPAARWWPAYSARISDHGKRAEFGIEAFVAQSSLEDWNGVALSLCTADMVQDIRLPELASLRLGRAQPAKRKGYRPPPEGLDALFAGYDSAMGGVVVAEPVTTEDKTAQKKPRPSKKKAMRRDAEERTRGADLDEEQAAEYEEGAPETSVAVAYKADAPMDDGIAPPREAPAAPAPAMQAMPILAPQSKSAVFRGAANVAGMVVGAGEMLKDAFGGGVPGGMPKPSTVPARPEAEVSEDWLDFDSLVLPDMTSRGRRGRLVRQALAGYDVSPHVNAVEYAQPPASVYDVRSTRGMFDHQFNADGKVEIPCNGKAHRVFLYARETPCTMRFVCVASEDDRVFREAELLNLLEAPLLPGPVDVFVEGALLTTSALDAVDRGGKVRVGLGVEERLRVTRNVRANEESKGLLGGSTAVNHNVSIDVSSSLPGDVLVELIERLPVSEDKEIQVALVRATPTPESYDQKLRGQSVKGGKLFKLAVKPGAKAAATMDYTITLPAGSEIIGGNRRD